MRRKRNGKLQQIALRVGVRLCLCMCLAANKILALKKENLKKRKMFCRLFYTYFQYFFYSPNVIKLNAIKFDVPVCVCMGMKV